MITIIATLVGLWAPVAVAAALLATRTEYGPVVTEPPDRYGLARELTTARKAADTDQQIIVTLSLDEAIAYDYLRSCERDFAALEEVA